MSVFRVETQMYSEEDWKALGQWNKSTIYEVSIYPSYFYRKAKREQFKEIQTREKLSSINTNFFKLSEKVDFL